MRSSLYELSPRISEKSKVTLKDLIFSTATRAAEAVARNEVSSVELTKALLHRVELFNPRLNAITTLLGSEALKVAKTADEAVKTGEALGPLHGVPVTVKECFEMKNVRTTAGSPPLAAHISERDSAVVERIRAAGAIILGHTNVPAMAADWQTYNPIFGTTNNPWDTSRTPGGSTGGGAAALAAGLTFLEIGSDIGGSIRVPSHFCGVYGHKPSLGAVSSRGHIPPAPGTPIGEPSLSVAGPLARSAGDLKIAMSILGGPDGDMAKGFSWAMPRPRKVKLEEYRLGFVIDDPRCRLSSEVKTLLVEMLKTLRKDGLDVVEGWPKDVDPQRLFEDYRYLRYASSAGSMSTAQIQELLRGEMVDDDSDEYAAAHAYASTVKEFQDAIWRRVQAQEAWREYFKGMDAFLIPVSYVSAFPHDHKMPLKSRIIQTSEGPRRYQELRFWISIATLCGLPATVAPIGLTGGGLPVGVQILGPYMEDATPIYVAEKLASRVGGFRSPPGYD
jgi:amidase